MRYTDRIRSLREDRDLRQRDVAALLNVGQKTYSDYELGKTRIPLESILKLAEFYDVDANYICGLTDTPSAFPKKKPHGIKKDRVCVTRSPK